MGTDNNANETKTDEPGSKAPDIMDTPRPVVTKASMAAELDASLQFITREGANPELVEALKMGGAALAVMADDFEVPTVIAKMDEDGYFYIVDRKKDMFISGGENIYPVEIENVLYKHPAVHMCAVIGVPDERMGEVARAYIVPAADAELDEAGVIAWSRQHMANYKVPRSVRFLDEFPMNAGGKILKGELRELAARERG